MFFWRRRRHPIGDEDLSAYVDGQLGEAERARLEAHVETCDACRDALAEMRALQRSIRELPQVPAPRSFALREADVSPRESPRPLGALERAPALLGGLATVAFLVFGALVAVDLSGEATQEQAGIAPMGRMEAFDALPSDDDAAVMPEAADGAPDGEMIEKSLEDGDALALDAERTEPGHLAVSPEPADGAAEEDLGADAYLDADAIEGSSVPSTPECGVTASCLEYAGRRMRLPTTTGTPTPTATPTPVLEAERDGDSRVGLRAAEAATAALALLAVGSLALVLRRRRS